MAPRFEETDLVRSPRYKLWEKQIEICDPSRKTQKRLCYHKHDIEKLSFPGLCSRLREKRVTEVDWLVR